MFIGRHGTRHVVSSRICNNNPIEGWLLSSGAQESPGFLLSCSTISQSYNNTIIQYNQHTDNQIPFYYYNINVGTRTMPSFY